LAASRCGTAATMPFWPSSLRTRSLECARLAVFEGESSRARRNPPLLKALPAVDWAPLSRLKGNGRFLPALGARRCRLDPMVVLPAHGLTPFRLTGPTTFWFVLEPLVGVEELLTGGENELRTAVHTLQSPVPVLHRCTPQIEQGPTRFRNRSGLALRGMCRSHSPAASGSLILFVSGLLACPLASQGRFDSLLFTRL
jgi:hypothetical protein